MIILRRKNISRIKRTQQTYDNFQQMADLFDESEILLDFSEDDSVQEELEEKL